MAGAAGAGALLVGFPGDDRTVATGTALTFGRSADLVVDDANPYLHRVTGRFVEADGLWWLENLGALVELAVHGVDGTVVRVPPGARVPLVVGGAVRFEAGDRDYELDVRPPRPPPLDRSPDRGAAGMALAAPTTRYGAITLTADERALLVALCRPFLDDPDAGPDDLPANRAVAHALGWTITKLNRKLDYLCTRLTRDGVAGLQGGRGAEATNRRWRLVQHAIAQRLVG